MSVPTARARAADLLCECRLRVYLSSGQQHVEELFPLEVRQAADEHGLAVIQIGGDVDVAACTRGIWIVAGSVCPSGTATTFTCPIALISIRPLN